MQPKSVWANSGALSSPGMVEYVASRAVLAPNPTMLECPSLLSGAAGRMAKPHGGVVRIASPTGFIGPWRSVSRPRFGYHLDGGQPSK